MKILSGEFKKQKSKELKQNCLQKKNHGQFVMEIPDKVEKNKS